MTVFASALAALASCATAGSGLPDIEKAVARVARRTDKPLLTVGPLTGDLRMFRMVTARGKPRELGRALGMIGIERGYPFPAVPGEQRERNASIIALYRDVYPAYLERVAGLAEAYGRKLEDLDLAYVEFRYFERMQMGRRIQGAQARFRVMPADTVLMSVPKHAPRPVATSRISSAC